MGFKPPLSRGIIKKFFLISSWVLLRRSQSKIVRLNFDRLSYRAHAEVQNPKSKIEMTCPSIGKRISGSLSVVLGNPNSPVVFGHPLRDNSG
jgi:hypothetical protein